MWDAIKKFLADRLDEKSTLRALTILTGLVGWKVSPEHGALIVEVVLTGLVFFGVMPDRKKTAGEVEADRLAEIELKKKELADLEAN